MLIRLVTGCSWVDAERLIGGAVSDRTLRSRRDEWERAGVFTAVAEEALAAYDKIIGFDLSESAVDGSQHKAPMGGHGTGRNPVDRGKLGWMWALLTDRQGIPIGWAADAANRHDLNLFAPTLADAGERGLLGDIETLHLDRGYDNSTTPPQHRSQSHSPAHPADAGNHPDHHGEAHRLAQPLEPCVSRLSAQALNRRG
jgi:putative transposase